MTELTSFETSTMLLPALLALVALALTMSGIAITFHVRRARLPDATRFEHVRELRAQEERLLVERRAEISAVDQKIHEKDRLIAEVSALEERRDGLQAELAGLDSARAEIDTVKREAAEMAAEYAEAVQKRDSIKDEWDKMSAGIDKRREDLATLERQITDRREEIARLSEERGQIEKELGPLRAEREAALRVIEELRAFEATKAALETEIERLEGNSERLLDNAAEKQAEIGGLAAELAQKRQRVTELGEDVTRLIARKAQLAAETTGAPSPEEEKELLDDLARQPTCLELPAMVREAPRTERDALSDVSKYLLELGLDYHHRAVFGFHTAMKINDKAQMTVLAGVSGTGKSLLPRRYAEAMGIHFLQIAVEPRWDSPQDLLGFYNYIEKRYRATDLARLLVHMDPYETAQLAKSGRGDHMALVLLDEMNLARVEYYFSEFLSRLEARPPVAEADEERKRKDALIPMDIRKLKREIALFPSHNVLFAGTMNDDESTQALSDKVLDRSNVLQFAAPRNFDSSSSAALGDVAPDEQAQRFVEWRSWVTPDNRLGDADQARADDLIKKLAGIMEGVGRPFGHRLRDAILAYAANYPDDGPSGSDVRVPLADQIEFRVMPKLRGVEIDSNREGFEALGTMIRNDLSDSEFADRLDGLVEVQSKGSGLFVWRGLTRRG